MVGLVERMSTTMSVTEACQTLGLARSWYYRHSQPTRPAQVEKTARARPDHALSEVEKKKVLEMLNSDRFQDQTPRQVYATLLDEGRYLCHWRTMYRILKEQGQVCERRQQRQHPTYTKPHLVATRPNQVWNWDITLLPGPKKRHYYLYVILDLYSRYAVGWLLAEYESAELAEKLIAETCAKQGVMAEQLTLHADRGSAMRAKSVAQLLVDLQVTKSHTRPYTPNDNPFSEAQFKTMKYRPDYPGSFSDQPQALDWLRAFFQWYNHEHFHSGLALMTPFTVHSGQVAQVQSQRQAVLNLAYEAQPGRFRQGQPVVARPAAVVWINPPTPVSFSGPIADLSQANSRPRSKKNTATLATDPHKISLDLPLACDWEAESSQRFSNELFQSA